MGIFGLGTHKVQNFGFFWVLPLGTRVMVLLGLFGDVHKVNCTWNLKAIDEFQSLLIFAGQIESRFSFQSTEFHKSR